MLLAATTDASTDTTDTPAHGHDWGVYNPPSWPGPGVVPLEGRKLVGGFRSSRGGMGSPTAPHPRNRAENRRGPGTAHGTLCPVRTPNDEDGINTATSKHWGAVTGRCLHGA